MIAFGVAVTDVARYERCAGPGIAAVAATEDLVMTRTGLPLPQAGNSMLQEIACVDGVEAVVLLDQDTRIACPDFPERVRTALADDTIGLVGVCGAIGSTGLAWWDGAEPVGAVGTETEGRVEIVGERPDGLREVDAVDATILILSASAARRVRFDERFERDFYGYDTDLCFQVRASGARVVVADLWCVRERTNTIGARRGAWVRNSLRFDRKWSGTTLPRAPSTAAQRSGDPPGA